MTDESGTLETTVDPEGVLPLLQEQAARGALVPFLGAGVSRDAGLPTWSELVAPLAEELGLEAGIDPIDVVDYFVESEGGDRERLNRYIRHRLRTVESAAHGRGTPARPGHLHRAVARIPAPVLFTTNFDAQMEEAIGETRGAPANTVVEDAEVGLIDETRGVTLVKLHGDSALPRTVVLARSDFEEYPTTHRAMIAYLQALLATRTFLFIGFSLVDPNFRIIYRAIREAIGARGRSAYALMQAESMMPLLRGWARRGVQPLLFPDFAAIRDYVERLATGARRKPGLPALEPHVTGMRRTLEAMIRSAAQGQERAKAVEEAQASLEGEEGGRPPVRPEQEASTRDLLELAAAVDRLTPLDPATWLPLGDQLAREGDAAGAIRAYNRALRPEDQAELLAGDTLVRVRGDLARALGQIGQHGQAEWLLRRCVFRRDMEAPAGDRPDERITERLNVPALARRPADAFELAYSVTRRAEALVHSQAAFFAVDFAGTGGLARCG